MTIKKQMRHVFRCPVIFGKDGGTLQAGYDSTWYGDTEDANFMWDTSANRMIFEGEAGITIDGPSATACIIFTDTAIEALINFGTSSTAIVLGSKSSNMYLDMRNLTVGGSAYIVGSYHKYATSSAMTAGGFYGNYQRAYISYTIQDAYLQMGKLDFASGTSAISANQVCATMSEVDLGGTGAITVASAGGIYGHLVLFPAVTASERNVTGGPIRGVGVVWRAPKTYTSTIELFHADYGDDCTVDYGLNVVGAGAMTSSVRISGVGNGTITNAIEITREDSNVITTAINIDEGTGSGSIITGIDIGDCTTGLEVTGATTDAIVVSGTPTTSDITLHNGATIMNTSSGVLTITELNVIITGNLQVIGTTTTIDTTTITVDDINIQLGAVTGGLTDAQVDGGGITLMGDGSPANKTIAWANTGDNWTFNQNVDLESTFVYKINNTELLSASTLTLSEGATIADSADEISAGTGPGLTITQDQIGLTGKVEIGYTDWGVAGAGAIAITGDGWDWALQVNAKVTANLADAGAAVYHSMTVTATQTSASIFGTWTELYFSDSINLTNSDNYAVVWGQLEAGTGVTFTDGEFTAAFYGNVKAGTSCTGASAINGFRAKLEIASTDSYTPGAGRLAAFESLASALEWDYGLYLNDYVTGIYFAETGAATEHLIDVIDAYLGLVIETGSYGDTATAVKLTSTNTRPASFLFDDGGVNIGGGADVRGVLSRIAVIAQQTGSSIAAMRGQCKLVGTIALTNYHLVGMEGYIEIAGTTTNAITLETDGSALACVRGRLEVNSDVTHATANTYMTAFFADLKVATGKSITQNTGILAGVVIDASNVSGAAAAVDYWGHGVYIADDATDIGITIGSTTTGIDIGACGTAGINIATGQVLGINIAGTTTAGILKAGVSDSSLISGGLGAPAIATSWVGIGIFGTLTGASGRNAGGSYPEDHGVNVVLKEDGEVQFMYAIQGRAYVIGDGAGQDGVAQEIFGLYGRARIDDNGTVGYGSNGQAIGVYGLCYLRVGGTSDVGGSGVLAGGRFSYKDQGITHTTSGVRCGIMAEVEEGTPECIMYLLAHSGAGTIANAIDINDSGNDVTNLLKIRQANGCGTDISSWYADTHQPDGSLQIDVAGTTYWIPIHATRHTS